MNKTQLFCVFGAALLVATVCAPPAAAYTPEEQQFLIAINQVIPPPRLVDAAFLKLGYEACAVMRSSQDVNAAKRAVWETYDTYGYLPLAGAQVGSIVHEAADELCPDVDYWGLYRQSQS